jgi:hypothetical protein
MCNTEVLHQSEGKQFLVYFATLCLRGLLGHLVVIILFFFN